MGPFLAKNLGTSISPWVVTMEALKPFLVDNYPQDPTPFPYLNHDDKYNFDIKLEVGIKSKCHYELLELVNKVTTYTILNVCSCKVVLTYL